MKRALLLLLVACGTTTAPTESPANRGSATPPPPPAVEVKPVELTVVEGTPSQLPDGTVVNVRGVMYAHMTDSRNLSSCSVTVTRGSEQAEFGLSREHGGPQPKAPPHDALGWRFTLTMADPYHQPSTTILVAEKLAP
jgi:hypothetical protein